MKFWDSSAVVPLLVAEQTTEAMQVIAAEDPAMLVWWATEVECLSAIARLERPAPHHPIVLGTAVAIGGGDATLAAHAAALATISAPASAAVRLLGLDPLAMHAMLARLAPLVADVGAAGAVSAHEPPSGLPSASAPALDLLAEAHRTVEVRLFAS